MLVIIANKHFLVSGDPAVLELRYTIMRPINIHISFQKVYSILHQNYKETIVYKVVGYINDQKKRQNKVQDMTGKPCQE